MPVILPFGEIYSLCAYNAGAGSIALYMYNQTRSSNSNPKSNDQILPLLITSCRVPRKGCIWIWLLYVVMSNCMLFVPSYNPFLFLSPFISNSLPKMNIVDGLIQLLPQFPSSWLPITNSTVKSNMYAGKISWGPSLVTGPPTMTQEMPATMC